MITKLYYWVKEQNRDSAFIIPFGLIFGLLFGFISDSSLTLPFVFAFLLLYGLAFGLAFGLVLGLAFGLVFLLSYGVVNISSLMPITIFSIILLIIGILILAELLISFNKKKKKISYGKVLWFKIDALFTSLLIIINILNLNWIFRHIKINFQIVLQGIGYIVLNLIILATAAVIIYLWLSWNKKRITK